MSLRYKIVPACLASDLSATNVKLLCFPGLILWQFPDPVIASESPTQSVKFAFRTPDEKHSRLDITGLLNTAIIELLLRER